jgi:hypothetical protein
VLNKETEQRHVSRGRPESLAKATVPVFVDEDIDGLELALQLTAEALDAGIAGDIELAGVDVVAPTERAG